MNKLIRDFHREAIQYTMENAGRKGQASCNAMCANKLAELIVLKCAEIADTAEPFLASDLIKEHFGIKE
jgi:hypothetical protein